MDKIEGLAAFAYPEFITEKQGHYLNGLGIQVLAPISELAELNILNWSLRANDYDAPAPKTAFLYLGADFDIRFSNVNSIFGPYLTYEEIWQDRELLRYLTMAEILHG